MFTRKIIVYQKYATKPVILTDTSDATKEEIQNSIMDVLKSDKISIIETSNDILYVRPSEVQAILVTKPNSENVNSEVSPEPPSREKKKYSDKLEIEKKQ
jgi:hypothetical protein